MIRAEFRHFPMPTHENAKLAGEACECAGKQGRFWAMHDALFANQKALSGADITRYAKSVRLNVEYFEQCLYGHEYASRVAEDKALATSFGISATPATFVNGRLVTGAVGIEQLVAVVDEEVAARTAATPSNASGSVLRK
jgi:protein-disulfide isomerase